MKDQCSCALEYCQGRTSSLQLQSIVSQTWSEIQVQNEGRGEGGQRSSGEGSGQANQREGVGEEEESQRTSGQVPCEEESRKGCQKGSKEAKQSLVSTLKTTR